jgi:photosystem II stability/assembly factor-like uncharacterized protein
VVSFVSRLVATALALACAACASLPPGSAGGSAAGPASAAIDLGAKFRIPDRERGKRDKAEMNAQYQLATEASESGPPTAAQIFRAHEQRRALEREAATALAPKSAGLQPNRWEAIGPSNVGGRVRALAFDPRSSRRIFAGTASGGLWHSEDAGQTWSANNDFLPNLSVTTFAFDAANPDVMYLGTGEASAGLVGVGVFKSVDGGRTWRYLAATNPDANPDWRFVNRLAGHPTQPGVLLAALTGNDFTSGAIYRSLDGGGSWTRVSPEKALDLAYDPNDPSRLVAGLDNGFIAFSRDGGSSFSRTVALVPTPAGRNSSARIEVAFARSRPGTVYASVDNAKGEIWRSADSGATWELVSTPAHIGNQGDYDNAIWVDPLDADHIVAGGLDLHRSVDGGVTFAAVSDWRAAPASPHADHHALVSPPDYSAANPVLYNGNDGGVYRTLDARNATGGSSGNGWANLNNGLAVTQFYGGAGRTAAGGRIVGGTQDNGSLLLQQGQWRPVRGGDGGFVAVDPVSDNTTYGEYVYLALHRSTNGAPSTYICTGITEGMPDEGSARYCGPNATKKANFIAPFILDPNNANRMLAGANSLWASDDVKSAAPTWRAIKVPSAAVDNYINAIAVAEGDGNRIWVGHNNGEVWRTTDGLSASPAWTRVGQGVLPGRRVQRIFVDRDDPQRVIVAVTGFVANNLWETRDGGGSWRSITSNLPQAPIFDVKRHPRQAAWLYVATSVGVFTSEDAGATWSTTNEGPANIRVRELFWLDDATLGAATYGRGMYKVAVAGTGPGNYQDLWWAGSAENGWGLSLTQHGSTLFGAMFIYDAAGKPVWAVMPGGSWDAGFTRFTGALYVPTGSWFGNYDTRRFDVGAPAGTATITFHGTSSATLQYTLNGVSGTKAIERQLFGVRDTTPVASFTDLWWGGTEQNGWGVAIHQQYRTIFAIWFTYDTEGRTTWYVVPGGQWNDSVTFAGQAFRTRGSPWLGAPYSAAAFQAQAAGEVSFRFDGLDRATMGYTVDGVTQSKPIVRQPF